MLSSSDGRLPINEILAVAEGRPQASVGPQTTSVSSNSASPDFSRCHRGETLGTVVVGILKVFEARAWVLGALGAAPLPERSLDAMGEVVAIGGSVCQCSSRGISPVR